MFNRMLAASTIALSRSFNRPEILSGSYFITHENTMCRIHKDDWSLGYVSVSGTEKICISGQRLRINLVPGHTDEHMALLHVDTNALIVGDHHEGQGIALLDITSGGNMKDYFQTTYKFMEIYPHVLIPMHGRVNLWPKHMLCGYLRNRRNRESTILKEMEGAAKTLFDVVSYTYADFDKGLWIAASSSNIRLPVDYLPQQDKLPKEFSVQRFQSSCGAWFLSPWLLAYANRVFPRHLDMKAMLCGVVTVAGFAALYTFRSKLNCHINVSEQF